MRCFLPDIHLAAELPEQAKLEEKLGGLPWGLPEERWPTCSDCGKHQSLLAQFVHDPARLDLGREGRVLFVFQCNHSPGMCENWTGGSGANACFVLEPEELIESLSPQPDDAPPTDLEVRIVGWREMDDSVSELEAAAFFNSDDHNALPEELFEKMPNIAHLGGVPTWVQGPEDAPKDGWHFVGQLDSLYSFFTPPNVEVPGILPNPQKYLGRSHIGQGPDFGDAGMGYIFLRPDEDDEEAVPNGWFFWQAL
jgi:hypothetical protein